MMKAKINPLTIFCSLIIIVSIFFASWFAIHGDIVFQTDIARDFLLMEDVVRNKPLTLIGPRSGGIPGVFHGPAWTYLNVPPFIIGNGNPAVISWFWVLLYLIAIYINYWVGKKIISENAGWVAAAATAVMSAFSVPGFFNPYGAVIFAPVFLYLLLKYVKTSKVSDLLWCLFTLGIVIQFQMAFGVPILVLTIPVLVYLIAVRNKKYAHFMALFILLIPLSTFILFDLKHQFLQTRSVLNYLSNKNVAGKMDRSFSDILHSRLNSIVHVAADFITTGNNWLTYVVLILYGYSIYVVFKNKKLKNIKVLYLLFTYFYIGYWLMTVLYKGVMWGYYYWPFLGLVALVFVSFIETLGLNIFYPVLVFFLVFSLYIGYKNNFKPVSYFGSDNSSWRFNDDAAKQIYKDAPPEFGYYVFTADQFGYPSRYAMNFEQHQIKDKTAFPYVKKTVTYLMIFPSDNPDINDGWWKTDKVKIKSKPVKVFTFKGSNFRIEKYILTPAEVNDKSDDTLIHTLIFR